MSKLRAAASGIQLFPTLRVPLSPSPQAALLTLRRIRAENRFSVHLVAWGTGSLFLITINPELFPGVVFWGAVVLAHGLRVHRGGRKKYRARLRALLSESPPKAGSGPARGAETAGGRMGALKQLRARLLETAEEVRDALRPVSPESLAEVSRGETRALALVSWLDDAERLMRHHPVERDLRRAVANRLSEAREPVERQALDTLLALLDRHQQRLGSLERLAEDHRSRVEPFLLALDNVKIARAGCCDVAAAAAPLGARVAQLTAARVARLTAAGPAAGGPPAAAELAAARAESDARLRQEVRLAQDLQRSILPAAAPEVSGLEVAHVYRPSSEVGGDFYDFYVTGEGRLLVALGDASGHGLDSSMVSSMAKSALYMEMSSGRDPGPEGLAGALAEINRMMCDTLGRRHLMTLTLVELDAAAGTISWVNAGQVYPLLRRGGEVTELEQPGYPLGVRREVRFRVQRRALEPGDLLLLLTDGYVEAADAAGEPFGWERLTAILAGSQASAPGALLDQLGGELNVHLQDGPAQDDVTLIAIGFRP